MVAILTVMLRDITWLLTIGSKVIDFHILYTAGSLHVHCACMSEIYEATIVNTPMRLYVETIWQLYISLNPSRQHMETMYTKI